jgi:hypothetical protein
LLARLGQLRVDGNAPCRRGGECARPRVMGHAQPQVLGCVPVAEGSDGD